MNADERQIEQEAIAIDLRTGAIVEEALVHANSTQICPASCFSRGGVSFFSAAEHRQVDG